MDSSFVSGFLSDLPEAESWVGTAFRPDAFRRGTESMDGQGWLQATA